MVAAGSEASSLSAGPQPVIEAKPPIPTTAIAIPIGT